MDFTQNNQMIDVTDLGITCGSCGTSITQLPFTPTPGKEVLCSDCHRARKQSRGPRQFNSGPRTPREMIDVADMGIKCASCSTPITQLPFRPDRTQDIYCRDCFRNNRSR